MALPTLLQQTAITNEKEALGLLREQKDIMKKLSDSIISNQRESGSLKKDVGDLKKEFVLGMQSVSEISKYFSELRSDKLKERRMETKENTNANIFSALVSKLMGKRESVADKDFIEIQTKLLEETRLIKSMAFDSMENVRFIKKSYEDKERAKERKLLAAAIAEAITDSDGKGGFLKGIVVPLLTGIGMALATVAGMITSGISAAITAGLATIGALIAKSAIGGLIPDLDVNRRGGGPIAAPIPGAPDTDPNKKDDKTKPKPNSTLGKTLKEGAGFIGRLTAPLFAAVTLATVLSAEETQYGTGENKDASSPEDVGGNPSEMGLPQAMAKVEAEKKAKALEEARLKQLQSSPDQSDAETSRLQRQSEEARLKDLAAMPDQSDAETRRLQSAVVEQQKINKISEEETDSFYDKMTAKMKEFVSSLGVDTDSLGKTAIDMLNNLGEIDFGGGKKINLIPNLGTDAAGMLDSLQDSIINAKDMMSTGGSTQVSTTNNTSIGGSTTTVPADSSAIDTDLSVSRYLKR